MTIKHHGKERTVNHSELGGVEDQKVFYPEFSIFNHPSGSIYQQIKGEWVLLQRSDGTKVRESTTERSAGGEA